MKTMKHRLSLLGVVAGLVAVVALTYVASPAIDAEAGQGAASGLTLNIHFHGGTTFDIHDDFPGHADGPFYVEGHIVNEVGDAIGEFNCWGWIRPGGPGFVSQEYNLFDRGAIQTQGREDFTSIAVVGGTGEFSNVRGEGFFGPPESDFPAADFSVRFQLQGR